MSGVLEIYREYEIRHSDSAAPNCMAFMYIHTQYDGEEDHRIGFGASVAECKAEIDEALDDV